jgi:fatty-acyl-CoA synthase
MSDRVLRTLPELLDTAVARSPGREVAFPGERATWPAVRRAARSWAAGLAALGVGRGDRVLLVLPSGLDAVHGIVGATLLGAIPTPVNPRGTAAEVAWVRSDAEPAVVVATPELVGLAGPGAVTPADLVGEPGDAPDVVVTPDDPMVLLYTSGTTSRPRGCVHTHGAYAALGENLVERLRLTPDDRFWTPLPLHHCGGIDVLLGSLAASCTLLHVGTFTPDLAWRQLVDDRASVAFPAFDTIWLPVLGHPDFDPAAVPDLRTVINVGPVERMVAMQARLPSAVQISCLGGTEAGGFCCVGSVDDPPEARAATSGVPLRGVEATVRDPVTGRACGPDELGEFLHRGVSRMAYYHRDPETTAERIDAQGWFHSGDLVRRDAAGRFTFVSRLKDMLKVGGENVAAAEVEGRLAEHPAVGVVAVVGAPDARLGEVAAAYVELTPAWRDVDREALAAELVAHCLAALAPFKAPRYVEVVESWPMSGTKVQKGELRQRIAADLAARGVTEAPRVSRPRVAGPSG